MSAALFLLMAWLLYQGVSELDYRWRWRRIVKFFFIRDDGGGIIAGPLLRGLWVTFQLSLFAGVLAVIFGMAAAAARLSVLPSLRGLAVAYIQFMRCTPLLVQLYLLYFMFGNVMGLERLTAGILALAWFEGAFAAEIFRAGVLAVPQGQVEAARALGLKRWRVWRLVVIPQSLPLILPPLANLFVSLIKHSSIVTIIAVADLTDVARNLVADTFLAFEIWLAVGALYVAVCFPLAWAVGRFEMRLRRGRA